MKTWLAETQHAISSLIPLVWEEQVQLDEATQRLANLEAATEDGYLRAQALLDDLDDEGLGSFQYWETYFGADKERFHAAIATDERHQVLEARAFARSSLASAILQIAKQGISAVHGGLDAAPAGREIHGVQIKDLIWQARNQAMHWEEGKPHKGVVECFDKLSQKAPVFSTYSARSLAFEVISLLDWRDVAAFERDLSEIG
jgi:hypothetical protein